MLAPPARPLMSERTRARRSRQHRRERRDARHQGRPRAQRPVRSADSRPPRSAESATSAARHRPPRDGAGGCPGRAAVRWGGHPGRPPPLPATSVGGVVRLFDVARDPPPVAHLITLLAGPTTDVVGAVAALPAGRGGPAATGGATSGGRLARRPDE